jgi:Protein of unknown function (DUF3037)
MPAETKPFAYSILRLVPCIERGELVNVGLCLFCRQFDFLELRTSLDEERLRAIAPDIDVDAVAERLATISAVISGEESTGALAEMPQSERFGWLAAPSSTMIQASDVHTGLTDDPGSELERLFSSLVL